MKQLLSFLRRRWLCGALALGLAAAPALAQETVCASVKIRILQELTMERQAFSAEMRINNTTDNGTIEGVSVVVKIMELDGTPVTATEDPNAAGAKFFVRTSSLDKISDVTGTGSVGPATTAIINWLIIPAPGSAGASSLGKKYLIGATLRYRFGGEEQSLEVSPDVVTVKPLPLLTLDYYLPQEVEADDPLTLPVEPAVPFNLGLRIKNNGFAVAKSVKIDSAQPKIIENTQGLLVNFRIAGSSIDDLPAQNTLLLNFGDISSTASKSGRWVMESSLSGRFTEFSATFSHADELGGAVTSILQATHAHLLIRDVRVDLHGRDPVRDFLAKDGDVIRVYESEGLDTVVTDRSSVAQLQSLSGTAETANYRLTIPPTDGFIYVKLPDPFGGTKALGTVMRSDAKQMLADNVWLSRSRNVQTKAWEYWVNFFDVNTPGVYETGFQVPTQAASAPVIQFIPDKVVKVGQQVSFIVEASSPQGVPVSLSAAPLPAGSTFTPQPSGTTTATVTRATFSWVPGTGTAGNYMVTFTATDGALSSQRSASIKVEEPAPVPAPMTPAIQSPLAGAQVQTQQPQLVVMTAAAGEDSTTQVQFELYADEGLTQQLSFATVARSTTGSGTATIVVPTAWLVPQELADNTRYWWRARTSDGTRFSLWADARFFVNLFNDPPGPFNLSSPSPDAQVATLTPTLSWTNSVDPDGDTPTYVAKVFRDEALSTLVTTSAELPANPEGMTSWVPVPLDNHITYYWQVVAADPLGAQAVAPARRFLVDTGNAAPSLPVVLSPPPGGESAMPNTILTIANSTDADKDPITYVFEVDRVGTFDSADKRSSGPVVPGSGGTTGWMVSGLSENQDYHWRVKALDGRAESAWAVASFTMNAVNDPPSAPTVRIPGDGAWVDTDQPSLRVSESIDPENKPVRYQFEVYTDPGYVTRVAEGVSSSTLWTLPIPLADKTTYYWRARALDNFELASAWTTGSKFFVMTGPYQPPTIAVTSPSAIQMPEVVNFGGLERRQVTIRWEGSWSGPQPNVALYYDTTNGGYAGNLIVDGLRPDATQSGSYDWSTSALAPGAYYVHAVIYDEKGQGQAYAPGVVVVPTSAQAGSLVEDNPNKVSKTTGPDKATTIRMQLARAPKVEVVVPLASNKPTAGVVMPRAFTFTPSNWNTWQSATVSALVDCGPDGKATYQIVVGKAQSLDPDYIGVSGLPYQIANGDAGPPKSTTDNAKFLLCGLKIVSSRQIDKQTWEYQLRGDLLNTGVSVGGVTARLTAVTDGTWAIAQPVLKFGAIGQAEVGRTQDTVTISTKSKISPGAFDKSGGYQWAITVKP